MSDMSKSFGKQIVVVALVAALVGAGVFVAKPSETVTAASDTAQPVESAQGKITVSGQGSVKVMPDIAYVDIGIFTEHANAATAQSRNAEQMANVLAALKEFGIKDEDIKTSGYYMHPRYNYSNSGSAQVTGYTINNNLSVTVRDITLVGEAIDTAIAAGANTSGGIQFTIADSGAYYAEALALAIGNAKSKSAAIAETLQVTIGTPVEIIENGGNYVPVAYAEQDMALQAAGASRISTPIQAGELEVTAHITAVFAY